MSIKEIRKITGLSQRAFAEKYHVPLQTIKQWESGANSTSFRKPPEYVEYMLCQLVEGEYREHHVQRITPADDDSLVSAAQHSYGNAEHWFRYLRKEFEGEKCRISSDRLDRLLADDRLSMFQKVSLKQAVIDGSPTNRYIISLNKRARTTMVDTLRKKYLNV